MVTGGAKGIGAAIAAAMAAEGAAVGLTDIDTGAAEAMAAAIRDKGHSAIAIEHDVSSEASWNAAGGKVSQVFDSIDIIVNNAGILMVSPISETSLPAFRSITRINIDGVFLGIKFGFETMGRKGGAIINLASIAGTFGAPFHLAYAASKAAVIQMTKCAAVEAAALGVRIRCNAIQPGSIDTPMTQTNYGYGNANSIERQVVGMVPCGRLGLASDIAHAAVYLASEEAAYVNGTSIVVDGGMTAGSFAGLEANPAER
jgi:NAD(P)-dependent dehydrogenase (short-subunit alcohol dehydrogenase family)